MVISEKKNQKQTCKSIAIHLLQFKLTLGAGGYTQTLNTISFIECENLIEIYHFIVMSQNGCDFRVFANTSLVNWVIEN